MATKIDWDEKNAAEILTMKSECSYARLHVLSQLEDHMIPVHEWPVRIARMWLAPRIHHNERYQLLLFLMANNAPPWVIPRWAKAQPGWLMYSSSANGMADLLEAHARGEFDGTTGKAPKTAWNVETKQYQIVHTPSFAYEKVGRPQLDYIPGASYWTDAIKELRAYANSLPKKPKAFMSTAGTTYPKMPATARPDKVELLNKWLAEANTTAARNRNGLMALKPRALDADLSSS